MILVMISLLSSLLFAWTNYTNVYVAKKVLLDSYPQCAAQIEEGVMAVIENEPYDAVLGEPLNFHCDTLTCPAYDPHYCQTSIKRCPSEVKAGEVKSDAKVLCNCGQAKKLAEAITYFIAKYDPMNLMINENASCREGFDRAVEDAIQSGNETWSVKFKCAGPNREFAFTSQKMFELVSGAESFAFAEAYTGSQPWFCYTLGSAEDGNSGQTFGTKKDGELCSSNTECESAFCNHNVCCSGEVCCPVPGKNGYPCDQGEVCSDTYTCKALNTQNGERCDYDEECLSGNCAPGSAKSQPQYCCNAGANYCCASNEDCVAGEECISNACTYTGKTGGQQSNYTNQTGNGTAVQSEKCLPIAILGIVLSALYAINKK